MGGNKAWGMIPHVIRVDFPLTLLHILTLFALCIFFIGFVGVNLFQVNLSGLRITGRAWHSRQPQVLSQISQWDFME